MQEVNRLEESEESEPRTIRRDQEAEWESEILRVQNKILRVSFKSRILAT